MAIHANNLVSFNNVDIPIHMAEFSGAEAQVAQQILNVSITCFSCGMAGTFSAPNGLEFPFAANGVRRSFCAAARICPNPDCQALVFTITTGSQLVFAFPSESIDFDIGQTPEPIEAALREAINCHSARCFKAAAIMVRRTIEEICADQKAEGNNLKQRIEALSTIITIPKALVEAMDHLRLLGNDAAHIEARVYRDLGSAEVEAGIELAKELVKATYQYADLVGKLTALRSSNEPTTER